jgi:hypothetical protein
MTRSFLVILYQDPDVSAELQAEQNNLQWEGKAMDNDDIRAPSFYSAMKTKGQPCFSREKSEKKVRHISTA